MWGTWALLAENNKPGFNSLSMLLRRWFSDHAPQSPTLAASTQGQKQVAFMLPPAPSIMLHIEESQIWNGGREDECLLEHWQKHNLKGTRKNCDNHFSILTPPRLPPIPWEVYLILPLSWLCTVFLCTHEPLVHKPCRGYCFPYLLLYHLVILERTLGNGGKPRYRADSTTITTSEFSVSSAGQKDPSVSGSTACGQKTRCLWTVKYVRGKW